MARWCVAVPYFVTFTDHTTHSALTVLSHHRKHGSCTDLRCDWFLGWVLIGLRFLSSALIGQEVSSCGCGVGYRMFSLSVCEELIHQAVSSEFDDADCL